MAAMRRLVLLSVMSGALMLAVGVPGASAQAPANDAWADATAVALPFSGTQDTTQATVGADDVAVGAACGVGPEFTASHSVWYEFTPSEDGVVVLDTGSSTYSTVGAVVTGTPDGFTAVSCFVSFTSFSVTAGQTYYVDVLDQAAGGAGGELQLSITFRALFAGVTVDGGSFDARTGAATVTGTASCSPDFVDGSLFLSLSQTVGRIATIRGYGWSSLTCDGTPHPWSAEVSPDSGLFKGGKARVEYSYSVCDAQYVCLYGGGTKTIVLKR